MGSRTRCSAAKSNSASSLVWPQPHGYSTDIAKAKALLAEASFPNGLETTLSFDLGFAVIGEPICVLVQESLAQIGIKATINKIPGANWRAELLKKELPMIVNFFSGWLDTRSTSSSGAITARTPCSTR